MSKKILDLSKWQKGKVIDWNLVKENIDGIILRIGYRSYSSSGKLYMDTTFKEFAKNCVKYDIPFGVYWFSQEITEKESIEAATFIVNILKNYKISYPIYYDIEYSGAPNNGGRADKLDRNTRTNCAIAFCEEIKKYGYTAGVYSSESYIDILVNFDKISKYNIWCAKYGSNNGIPGVPPKIKYDMWQYTSKGTIKGINTKVDLSLDDSINKTHKTIEDIAKEVIDGLWGNGDKRIKLLTEAGYDHKAIQLCVNNFYIGKYLIKNGDKVKLSHDAVYTNGKKIPNWIKNKTFYARSDERFNGDVVISILKKGLITGVVNKKYLNKI